MSASDAAFQAVATIWLGGVVILLWVLWPPDPPDPPGVGLTRR